MSTELTVKGEWQERFAVLGALAELEDGWNGYSAPAPTSEAIAAADRFLSVLQLQGHAPTRIAASAVGGVGITSRQGSRKVYVEFLNGGSVQALFADDEVRTMRTQRVADDHSAFRSMALAIEDYLNG